jgi:hypothetical protein
MAMKHNESFRNNRAKQTLQAPAYGGCHLEISIMTTNISQSELAKKGRKYPKTIIISLF